jgi:hypothetical protein
MENPMETPLVTNTTNTSLENAPHLDPGADLEQIPGAIISNGDLIDHILHYSDEKLAEDIATQPDKMWTWVATNMNRGHIAEYRVGMLMYHRQVLLAISRSRPVRDRAEEILRRVRCLRRYPLSANQAV